MITISRDSCTRIHEIHEASIKAIDNSGCTSNYDFIDILDLTNLMSTYNVLIPTLKTNIFYWKYLNGWLDYMQTGVWKVLPRFWYETMCGSKEDPAMPDFRVDAEYELYLQKRRKVCESLGLCHLPSSDNLVKLYWLSKKDGEHSFITFPHTLMRVYIYMNALDIKGLQTNAATINSWNSFNGTFDSADQAIWPIEGDNKLEVLQNNFKTPPEEHEKYI